MIGFDRGLFFSSYFHITVLKLTLNSCKISEENTRKSENNNYDRPCKMFYGKYAILLTPKLLPFLKMCVGKKASKVHCCSQVSDVWIQ